MFMENAEPVILMVVHRLLEERTADKEEIEDSDSSVTWDTVKLILVEQNGNTWMRIAIGKITISAWLKARQERQRIVLT
jgi:hypothetical protein